MLVDQYSGLPVAGCGPQSGESVSMVNQNRLVEETVLRLVDQLAALPEVDQRWLAIGRTGLEQAFMAINRAIFKPSRLKLPGE